MEAELLPCPFCGGEAEIAEADLPLGTGYYVACNKCDGQMGDSDDTYRYSSVVATAWNRRALPAMPPADWSQAPEWAMFWAVDANCNAFWYEVEPYPDVDEGAWWCPQFGANGDLYQMFVARVTLPLGCDWRQSLQSRPQPD